MLNIKQYKQKNFIFSLSLNEETKVKKKKNSTLTVIGDHQQSIHSLRLILNSLME